MSSSSTSVDAHQPPPLPALSLSAARLLVANLPRPAPSAKGKERASPEAIPTAVEMAMREELERAQYDKDALVDQLRRAIDELDAPLKPEGRMAPEDKRIAILEQEVACLEASLQAIQSPNPAAVDALFKASPALISFEAESKLSNLVSETEQAVVWESGRGARERKDLVRDSTLLLDAEKINRDLSKRVDDMRSARDDLTSEEIIARARAKSTKVAASFSGLMMALIQFIDERLAGLAENQDEDEDERGDNGRKKNPGNIISFLSMPRATAPQRALQLKQILENLMNTMATNPGDPYISIVGAPAELVNFLHQSGIIVADRKDDKRVKLVDFSARLGE